MMKIALGQVPVWWFRVGCVTAGGLGLLLISALNRHVLLPRLREFPALMLCAMFAIVGWHLCTGYGLTLMPAGRASIIAQTMPVWAAIFATFLLSERLTTYKLFGLILGVAGLAVLIGPDLVVVKTAPVGAMFMIAAAMSWAMGTVLFKRTAWSTNVAVTAGWMLTIGSVPITIGAILLEPFPDLTTFRPDVWIALAYIFLLPMIFGQWAFYKIVHLFSALVAAIGTMAVPVIGVISSALLIGEPVGVRDYIALGLVSAALASVLILPTLTTSRTDP
jgi:drug/metabolite transporter (DMT)-like permease